jgi:hypothetical protein
MSTADLRLMVGLVAVIAPGLHILSDILELLCGRFSPLQLSVSYIAFLAIPFVVIGLHAMQHSRGGWLSLVDAVGYGAAFIFFAGTAMYAPVRKTSDHPTMVGELGAPYTIHGVLNGRRGAALRRGRRSGRHPAAMDKDTARHRRDPESRFRRLAAAGH